MKELKGTLPILKAHKAQKPIGKISEVKTVKGDLILQGTLNKRGVKMIRAAQKAGLKVYAEVSLKKVKKGKTK